MSIKQLLNYPSHPEFEELLNSCGSMTKQLESLHASLNVSLINEGVVDDKFYRHTILSLNQTNVVAACSLTAIQNSFFVTLLQNANNTPIGKFLFAKNNAVGRTQIEIKLVDITQISDITLRKFLNKNYINDQQFWQRHSIFQYQNEQMELIEIMLPELERFFDNQ